MPTFRILQMIEFLDWNEITPDDFTVLESLKSPDLIKRKIRTIFKVSYEDEKKNEILTDFHFHNYIFCIDNAFDIRKISTLLAILNRVFVCFSMSDDPKTATMKNAYEHFTQLLLAHSVESPPNSVAVFNMANVEDIFDHVLESYFRQFKLYKYIFGAKLRLVANQVQGLDIEVPSTFFLKLQEGVELKIPGL